MFAMNFKPRSLNCLICPSVEFATELLPKRSEKRENFHCIERQFCVEIKILERIYDEIDQRLYTPRVFVEECVLYNNG